MAKKSKNQNAVVKVYHGYGHTKDLVLYGHVLREKSFLQKTYTDDAFVNFINLVRLFFITPVPDVKVRLNWNDQVFFTNTESDGFFKFEWQSDTEILAGWHDVSVDLLNTDEKIINTGKGKVFVPHSTQYGFISDIDDTVLISHSGTTEKKLWSMFSKNPRSRKTFADVVNFYELLAKVHTENAVPNPFFYISSSEWNLYDYLNEFFKFNKLPKGVFLLNNIKKWYQLFKIGNTKHLGKFNRIERVLKVFPAQKFILLGDNSQSDPEIYKSIADKYPQQIFAIYIRNISAEKFPVTIETLGSIINKGIYTLLYKHTSEAILHSKSVGLIG